MFELSLFPDNFFGNKGITRCFRSVSITAEVTIGNGSTGNSGRRLRRMIGSNWFIALNRIRTNGDLFPVRAIADGDARHRARAARREMNDTTRKLCRRHTSGHRCRDIGERRDLDLFAGTKLFKTAWNIFSHKFVG